MAAELRLDGRVPPFFGRRVRRPLRSRGVTSRLPRRCPLVPGEPVPGVPPSNEGGPGVKRIRAEQGDCVQRWNRFIRDFASVIQKIDPPDRHNTRRFGSGQVEGKLVQLKNAARFGVTHSGHQGAANRSSTGFAIPPDTSDTGCRLPCEWPRRRRLQPVAPAGERRLRWSTSPYRTPPEIERLAFYFDGARVKR